MSKEIGDMNFLDDKTYLESQSSLSLIDLNNTAARAGSCELGSLSLMRAEDPNESIVLVVRSNNDKTASMMLGLLVQAFIIGGSTP